MVDWGNAPAWAGIGIGAFTVAIGWRSVRQARQLQKEQARPYVVAFMERTGSGPHLFDLVIKNLGRTAALRVKVASDPPLVRSLMGAPDVKVPDVIPTLVPDQEWRTLWDSSAARLADDAVLPKRHDVTVTYEDSEGKKLSTASVLDWETHVGRLTIQVYGVDEAAQALESIAKTMKGWNESLQGGLQVFHRDGDAKDAAVREEHERWQAEIAERQPSDQPDG